MGVTQAQESQGTFKVALAKANAEGKPIVLIFSGSDWCAPCIKLKKHIFDSEEFKTYAKEHYVMYVADFPRKKANQLPEEQMGINKTLAAKYNQKGYFPLVVVLDKDENVLGETGFVARTSPEKYIEKLNGFLK
ncbi:Thioredoxin-like [Flagellimonas zhangzhouensis]|uniref:Thioredoxin-like n=1 Tax=Flagellimonas zhangzhouensis TaxID=1073328 RepID=A0A1H2QPG8_9FLAO|nr:Thioredoxin-like [Allomuricauda zhangzhouensis]SDW09052.1 Thioredoxin-like [Allomuricauda zhangzhouensis]